MAFKQRSLFAGWRHRGVVLRLYTGQPVLWHPPGWWALWVIGHWWAISGGEHTEQWKIGWQRRMGWAASDSLHYIQRQKVTEEQSDACNSSPTEHETVEFNTGRQKANQTWELSFSCCFLDPQKTHYDWADPLVYCLGPLHLGPSISWEGIFGQEINDMEGTSLSKRGNSTCLPTPPRADQWCQRRGSQ